MKAETTEFPFTKKGMKRMDEKNNELWLENTKDLISLLAQLMATASCFVGGIESDPTKDRLKLNNLRKQSRKIRQLIYTYEDLWEEADSSAEERRPQ